MCAPSQRRARAAGDVGYYARFLRWLRSRHPTVKMPDAVAIHPYLRNADGVKALAQSYWDTAAVDHSIAPFQHALNDPDPTGVCTMWNSFFGWCSNQSA